VNGTLWIRTLGLLAVFALAACEGAPEKVTLQGQTMGADPRDILRPHVDQGHIVSMLGETSDHVPGQRADPDDRDSLRHIASSRYKR